MIVKFNDETNLYHLILDADEMAMLGDDILAAEPEELHQLTIDLLRVVDFLYWVKNNTCLTEYYAAYHEEGFENGE